MVKIGIEVLLQQNFALLDGLRVGLLTNGSAVDGNVTTTYQHMLDSEAVNVTALFGPEHGAFGAAAAGELLASSHDSATGIVIHSLYGASYRPTPDMLGDIDILVCDIQDIGVRYYTYLWTMTHVLEACGESGVPVAILDRPNPLGDTVAGCGLDPKFASLVGRYDVPIQHGMTMGEVLAMHNELWNEHPAELTVVACQGYDRTSTWADLERPFSPTSPNIPHYSTVQHYPGSCLIEGTNISEGRGTTLPFQIAGAPYLNGMQLATELNAIGLPDVRFRPHQFTPSSSKHAGVVCDGIQVHRLGDTFEPIRTWLTVITTVRAMFPDEFQWVAPLSEGDHPFFDKLIGNAQTREQIDAGMSVEQIMQSWESNVARFRRMREPFLLY